MSPMIMAAMAAGTLLLMNMKKPVQGGTQSTAPLPPPDTVKGKSGTTWKVQLVKRFNLADGRTQLFFDVFTVGGTRVVRYHTLAGTPGAAKVSLGSPDGVDPAIVKKATSDFGLVKS